MNRPVRVDLLAHTNLFKICSEKESMVRRLRIREKKNIFISSLSLLFLAIVKIERNITICEKMPMVRHRNEYIKYKNG